MFNQVKLFTLLMWALMLAAVRFVTMGAVGATRYPDISSLINDVYDGSLFTLRAMNLLARTVTFKNDQQGLQPRKATEYGSANFRQRDEGEDIVPTKFERSLLATLTPDIYSDQFLITDQRIRTDSQGIRADASMEMGAAAAELVDTNLAGAFSNLTGGSVAASGSTVQWKHIVRAKVTLRQAKVPGPYFCVLGEGQWGYLLEEAGLENTVFSYNSNLKNEMVENYFITPKLGDVTFVVTPNISGAGTDTGIGAMYSRLALAYDERLPFTIEPERDASKTAWELNANLEFATGVWDAKRGVQIIGLDTVPSS